MVGFRVSAQIAEFHNNVKMFKRQSVTKFHNILLDA